MKDQTKHIDKLLRELQHLIDTAKESGYDLEAKSKELLRASAQLAENSDEPAPFDKFEGAEVGDPVITNRTQLQGKYVTSEHQQVFWVDGEGYIHQDEYEDVTIVPKSTVPELERIPWPEEPEEEEDILKLLPNDCYLIIYERHPTLLRPRFQIMHTSKLHNFNWMDRCEDAGLADSGFIAEWYSVARFVNPRSPK